MAAFHPGPAQHDLHRLAVGRFSVSQDVGLPIRQGCWADRLCLGRYHGSPKSQEFPAERSDHQVKWAE